jgi:hypothetical protein
MPDDEELERVPSKRKFLNWTPLAFLNSLGHTTGFSTSKAFNKEGDSGLDFLELPTAGTANPALAPVQAPRMHVRALCY